MPRLFARLCIVIGLALPVAARAQNATQAPSTDQTFLDFQVEQAVRIKSASSPIYPAALHASRVTGEVIVQFVVDERGNAQMETFKVLKSNNNAFSESVRQAVRSSQFYPAEIAGKKVKQLVQQPYRFAVGK